ncbi:hypothetical protein N6H14_17905 [Paenibacillus sp. CC-CFT747]|nr:hypothetical protein N6H14_17905 [Paenibacillus sp. CC-CFT747]
MISYARADYLLETESDYIHSEISAYNELALKHALMNLYSAYLIHHEWGLLLHSSCVVDRGRAVVFAGPSGAGKSTAAQLSQPRELLSDEATLVRITPRKITVYDSPFRSELHGSPDQPVCPLSSIQLLKQSPINLRNPISKPSALLQMTDKVFYWAHDPEETRKAFSLLVTLTEAVPVYELFFQKNDTFWELIS